MSAFHEMNGYYAQGVEVSTATLPAGWRDRVVPYDQQAALPSRAVCLDPHDLVVSKLAAGRPKDLEFARALVWAKLIQLAVLRERAAMVEVPADRGRVMAHIRGVEEALGRGRPLDL